MLGKLLKYEFKATGRTFVPLYIAIILVSFLIGIFFNPNGGDHISFNVVLIVILSSLFIALGVLTILVIIQRFNKNLLGDEGYLMFTLPVTAKKIISSKVIVSIVWFLFSGIVSIVSFCIIVMSMGIKEGWVTKLQIDLFFEELYKAFSIGETWSFIGKFIEVGVLGLVSFGVFILMIYLCISIGQLPIFSKHKIAVAFIAFFIINIIVSYISSFSIDYIESYTYLLNNFHSVMLASYVETIILGLITFFSTSFILEKKLNLE